MKIVELLLVVIFIITMLLIYYYARTEKFVMAGVDPTSVPQGLTYRPEQGEHPPILSFAEKFAWQDPYYKLRPLKTTCRDCDTDDSLYELLVSQEPGASTE